MGQQKLVKDDVQTSGKHDAASWHSDLAPPLDLVRRLHTPLPPGLPILPPDPPAVRMKHGAATNYCNVCYDKPKACRKSETQNNGLNREIKDVEKDLTWLSVGSHFMKSQLNAMETQMKILESYLVGLEESLENIEQSLYKMKNSLDEIKWSTP